MASARPRMLELFSGSQQMSKVAAGFGFDVITLDIDAKTEPAICVNILEWDFTDRRWGGFDYIHASPPCEELSLCHTRSERNMDLARNIAERTRKVIEYFLKINRRCLVTIENPATSLLGKEEQVVGGLAISDASYCCYGYPYRKNTRFWHNFPSLPLRRCPDNCFWKREHPVSVQHAPPEMRAKIPMCLCFEILSTACVFLGCSLRPRMPLNRVSAPQQRTRPTGVANKVVEEPPARKKRGRPRQRTNGFQCSMCGTETTRRFYNTSSSTLPIQCTACYRKARRQAKRTDNNDHGLLPASPGVVEA